MRSQGDPRPRPRLPAGGTTRGDRSVAQPYSLDTRAPMWLARRGRHTAKVTRRDRVR